MRQGLVRVIVGALLVAALAEGSRQLAFANGTLSCFHWP